MVLGFETTLMENGLQSPLERIEYQSELPQLIDHKKFSQAITFGLPNPGLGGREVEWALTKHSDWAYEKEWRFVTTAEPGTTGEYEDFPIPRGALVEFVAGCRTNEEQSDELLSLAHKIAPDIAHYQMKQHPHRFELNKSKMDF